jgi:hypothetical protein
VDGAHVMGSPFALHCRPGAAVANKSSLDAAVDAVRAGEPADQLLMNVDGDEEVVFDLWDEPLPASPAPRKTASFAKRSAAEKAAAEEALVASMKAAAAKKKARGKPPPPPPRRLRFGLAAAAPEKAAASSSAKVPIDAPTSSSSSDLGKEIGQAVSFVFVESPMALFKTSADSSSTEWTTSFAELTTLDGMTNPGPLQRVKRPHLHAGMTNPGPLRRRLPV